MGREGGRVGGRDAWESGKRRSVGSRTNVVPVWGCVEAMS
jgi:hypothetical protein